MSNFTLHHLSSLTALEELRLADCRKISGNFVAAIKPLARLRYVNVAGAGKNGRGGEKIAAKVKKRAPKGCVVDSFSLEIAQAIPDWSEAVFRVAMRRLFLDKGGSRPDPSNAVFRDAVATALDPDKREVTDADRTALESNPRLLPFFVDTAAEVTPPGAAWEQPVCDVAMLFGPFLSPTPACSVREV